MAKEYGLQFFYHNHDFEFDDKQADGTPVYDLLLAETDDELVMFELDLYWITYANENPLAYLSEHADRFFAYHVKDRVWKDAPGRPTTSRTSAPAGSTSATSSPPGGRRAGQALLRRARPAAGSRTPTSGPRGRS